MPHRTPIRDREERRLLLERAAANNWTLQATADRLGVTRQRAEQLFREYRVSRDPEAYRRVRDEQALDRLAESHPLKAEFVRLAEREGIAVTTSSRRRIGLTMGGLTVHVVTGNVFREPGISAEHPGYFRHQMPRVYQLVREGYVEHLRGHRFQLPRVQAVANG